MYATTYIFSCYDISLLLHPDTIAAYAESIYPVGDIVEWDVGPEVKNRIVLPPILRRRSTGRLRKN